MPELPDVEGFKKFIDEHCRRKPVRSVEAIIQPGQKARILQLPEADFAAATVDRQWVATERRGKFLIVSLSDGNSIVFHFMLTGDLVYLEPDAAGSMVPSARVRFTFDDGSKLIFTDRRNLGRIFWVEDRDFGSLGVLAKLGVEPLSRDFTRPLWQDMTRGDRHGDMTVKDLLCDQSVIAGIGNIYSDAILWEARVRPDRVVRTLSEAEVDRLYDAIPGALRRGVQQVLSGTVEHDELMRQRRQGGLCPRCGSEMAAMRRGATHSYFCPTCQK